MGSKPAKILTLQADAPEPPKGNLNSQRELYSENKITNFKKKEGNATTHWRQKYLDAFELMHDHYLT